MLSIHISDRTPELRMGRTDSKQPAKDEKDLKRPKLPYKKQSLQFKPSQGKIPAKTNFLFGEK